MKEVYKMGKKIWFFLGFSLCFLIAILYLFLEDINSKNSASTEPQEIVEVDSPYKEFDEIAEKYFIANIIGDFDTMKKYLPSSEIEKDPKLMSAKEDTVLNPEYKEMITGRYKITATDFYYETHNQIFYHVEFFEPSNGNPHGLGIYGVQKQGDKYSVMNRFDSRILGLQFKPETGKRLLVPSTLKKIIEKYPDNAYEVKPQF